MKRLALLTLCLLAISAQPALAQSRSVSYSIWSISGSTVILRFLVPAAEAARLSGTDIPILTSSKLAAYVLQHVGVQASGNVCSAIDQGYDIGQVDPLSVGRDLYGFEIMFHCATSAALVLRDAVLFDRVSDHVNFARIQIGNRFSEQLFTSDRRQLQIQDGSAMPDAGLGRYLRLGSAHIWHSLDRLCFLLAVLLLVRRRRDLGYVVTGLALGYLLSVAENAGGWIAPNMSALEASIGFMVALLAITMLTLQVARPRIVMLMSAGAMLLLAVTTLIVRGLWPAMFPLGAALLAATFLGIAARGIDRAPFWLIPTAIFGFLDGFVLPSMITPLALPRRKLLPMLTGFDFGAVLVEALLLLLVAAIYALLQQRKFVLPRSIVNDIAAAGLGGLGVFWLLTRLYV